MRSGSDQQESVLLLVESLERAPKKQKALRFGYYSISAGKRVKVHGGACFEISTLEDLKKKMEEKETPAIKAALKEIFG